MFNVGDVVEIFAPTAGKKKYHLCVCCANDAGVVQFFFINSGDGYEADFVLADGQIGDLPESPTGKSVISCSIIVRYTPNQMTLYKAKKIGTIEAGIASDLADFISTSRALPKKDRAGIATALGEYAMRSS